MGGNDPYYGKFFPSSVFPPGRLAHISQHGTDDWDIVNDIAVADTAVFIAGETFGSYSGPDNTLTDALLIKYDNSGAVEWVRQYGDNADPQGAWAVATDGQDAVYIAGFTYIDGSYNAFDETDGFLAKYDYDGNLLWERYLISEDMDGDMFEALAIDDAGNVYVGGYTDSEVMTPSSSSAVLHKYSPEGDMVWTTEFEFDATHRVKDIAVDGSGSRIWVVGDAYGPGTFGEDNTADAFLVYLETPGLPGDFNNDMLVNGADFFMWQRGKTGEPLSLENLDEWQSNFGAPGLPGDFNNDMLVNSADFFMWQRGYSGEPLSPEDLEEWQSNFGSGLSVAASTAIPEPSAALMAILSIATATIVCRKVI